MSKALSLSLAVGLAFGLTVDTATALPPQPQPQLQPQPHVTFFLADPELGMAGVYRANGAEIYFEARRAEDVATGAPGALSLRFVDAEGRTLALGGEPLEKRWVPKKSQFTAADAGADMQLLSGLGNALRAATLHAALSAEKSALADLALQTAGTPASRLPVRAAVNPHKSAAADVNQVASFYASRARGVQVKRERSGLLQADLGDGIVLQSTQKWVMDEPDENGRMGRIDAYSIVKSSDGHVLSAEFGGDEVPNGWGAAVEKISTRDHVAIATDLGRAATALQALAYSGKVTKGVALSNQGEIDAMQRHARSLVVDLLPQRDELNALTVTPSTDFTTMAGRYSTTIQVWRKPHFVIAQHSGTRVYRYSYSSMGVRYALGAPVNYCNHGTCPGAENMTYKCTYAGPVLSYVRMPSTNEDNFRHSCDTPYWATALYGFHNCHDDSSIQVRAIRGLSYSTTGGRCNNGTYSPWAPACDGS